jgi:hypothetical protein
MSESDEHMVVEVLFEDFIYRGCRHANPLTRRRRIELAELVNEPWTAAGTR